MLFYSFISPILYDSKVERNKVFISGNIVVKSTFSTVDLTQIDEDFKQQSSFIMAQYQKTMILWKISGI